MRRDFQRALARLLWLFEAASTTDGRSGVAAGIAAAFNAPIAAVTCTLGEVVGDLDQTMFSGVIAAAAIAAMVERSVLGQHPVFEMRRPFTMGPALSLGRPASAVRAIHCRAQVGASRDRRGALTGTLALVAMLWLKHSGIAGGGYGTLSLALTGSLPLKVLLGLCVMKLAAVCSYSSGGAGGIFVPIHRRKLWLEWGAVFAGIIARL